jgi:hypothetical protein
MVFVRALSVVAGTTVEGGTTVVDIGAMEVCAMVVAWLGGTPDIGLLLGWEFVAHGVATTEAYAVARSMAMNTKYYGCWDCEGGR